jgi:predicted RNA-binding protein with TRAM domain
MYRNESSEAPVQEGETIDVTISAVGAKGDGIARVKGFVLFVAGTRAGENVTVRVTKVLPKVGFAEVVKRNQPIESPKEEASEQSEEQPEQQEAEEKEIEDSETFGEE